MPPPINEKPKVIGFGYTPSELELMELLGKHVYPYDQRVRQRIATEALGQFAAQAVNTLRMGGNLEAAEAVETARRRAVDSRKLK